MPKEIYHKISLLTVPFKRNPETTYSEHDITKAFEKHKLLLIRRFKIKCMADGTI